MADLIIDKKHKRIDASKVGKPFRKITSGVLGTVLGLSMYSGILPKVSADEIQNDESIVLYENDDLEKLDFGEAVSVSYNSEENMLSFVIIGNNYNLEKLKNLKNIKKVDFTFFYGERGFDSFKYLPDSVESVSLTYISGISDRIQTFTIDDAEKLNQLPNLKELSFCEDICVEENTVENMKNLKTLSFGGTTSFNCDIDFKKLGFLDELNFTSGLYTIPIWFNTEEYNTLVQNGVKIKMENISVDDYLNVSKKLDDIISSLDVTKESSDYEKTSAIIEYLLKNYQYFESRDDFLFDVKGPLSSPLQNGKKLTPLEYSAMFEALADRLFFNPSDSFDLQSLSFDKGWNMVNIDGELYYLDSSMFNNSDTIDVSNLLIKYKSDQLGKYPDGLQETEPKPYYFEYYSERSEENRKNNRIIPKKENIDSDEKVKVKINGKIIVTTVGVLIGCLTAIGLAYSVNKGNRRRRAERRRKYNYIEDDSLESLFSSHDEYYKYNNNSSNHRKF